jgi:hypothetical protein
MTSATEPTLEVVFFRAADVVGRNIGGQFVLVPLAAHGADLESIFHLNRLGSFIWELLDGQRSGERIVHEVMDRFAVERDRAVADYRRFLAQLESIRVVRRLPAAGGPSQNRVPGRE